MRRRLAKIEARIPRGGDAEQRRMLREMTDEELRAILRNGLSSPHDDPRGELEAALSEMGPEGLAALCKGPEMTRSNRDGMDGILDGSGFPAGRDGAVRAGFADED